MSVNLRILLLTAAFGHSPGRPYNPRMDDQQTYLLNGLLTRQFDIGRIVRFRQTPRGRQAVTYEFLTAEQHEYLVHLYPPAFDAERLAFVGTMLRTLDENRFTVMPWLPTKSGDFLAEGLQGTHLVLSLSPTGTVLPAAQYTTHDISQVGLRLAWMHRLLREQIPTPSGHVPLSVRLAELLAHPTAESARAIPSLPPQIREMLTSIVGIPLPYEGGWVHGQMQADALLHDADHQLRTVTDWGLLHVGSPLEDLVDAFLSLCVGTDGTSLPRRYLALREAYESLIPLKDVAWTPVVGAWCAQRLLDAAGGRRALPKGFSGVLGDPERLACALAATR
jgi:Ser/Thr protein kinase RdoA (MazF antagonist)